MEWRDILQYWWLVFPIGGMIGGALGGAFKSLGKENQRRHERKMERLRLKYGQEGSTPQSRQAPAPAAQDNLRRQTTEALKSHKAVNDRWLAYELDVARLIDYPAMTDVREPLTSAYLKAKRKADRLAPESADVDFTQDQLREYQDAVDDYLTAFDAAEREAMRVKDNNFTPAERDRLKKAKQFVAMPTNQGSSDNERKTAYQRALKELDGVLLLPEAAREALERKVNLGLSRQQRPETA